MKMNRVMQMSILAVIAAIISIVAIIISILKRSKVNVPEPLRLHYPELEEIASTPPEART